MYSNKSSFFNIIEIVRLSWTVVNHSVSYYSDKFVLLELSSVTTVMKQYLLTKLLSIQEYAVEVHLVVVLVWMNF